MSGYVHHRWLSCEQMLVTLNTSQIFLEANQSPKHWSSEESKIDVRRVFVRSDTSRHWLQCNLVFACREPYLHGYGGARWSEPIPSYSRWSASVSLLWLVAEPLRAPGASSPTAPATGRRRRPGPLPRNPGRRPTWRSSSSWVPRLHLGIRGWQERSLSLSLKDWQTGNAVFCLVRKRSWNNSFFFLFLFFNE